MSRIFAVYGLKCTCHPEEGIRYVGKTENSLSSRLKTHFRHARTGVSSHLPVGRWIIKHGIDQVEMVTIEVCDSRESVRAAERKWISDYRERSGSLLNIRDGGEDHLNPNLSPEYRAKMSELMRGRDTPWTRGENNRSAKLTREDVLDIRSRLEEDTSILAEEFGVHRGTIYQVQRGRSWRGVGGVLRGDRVKYVSKGKKDEIKDLLRSEMPVREIASKLNLDRTTIYRIARRAGLRTTDQRSNYKLTYEDVLKIRKGLARGDKATHLAKEYGVSDVTISNIKHETTWKEADDL